jgi:hypothetical protein
MIEREIETASVRSAAREQPARRLERALAGLRLPLAVSLLALLAGLLAWRPSPLGIWHDDGVMRTGRALADGQGYRLVGVPGSPAAARFPPVYPALLAPLWRIAPSPGTFARLAVAVNFVLLALAAGAFALYLRDRLRLGALVAAVAATAGWLHLQLWYTAFVPLSEPLFMLLLVATLASLERAESGGVARAAAADVPQREDAGRGPARGSRWRDAMRTVVLPVLLLLLLVHTRSIGVAFVAGAVRSRCAALAVGRGSAPPPVRVCSLWWWWAMRWRLPGAARCWARPGRLGDRVAADPGAFLLSGRLGHAPASQ